MYRSQLLLKQLGIHQWIPQHQPTALYQADELWRDKNTDISPPPILMGRDEAKSEKLTNPSTKTSSSESVIQTKQKSSSVESTPLDFIDDVNIERSADISFHCHVIAHEQFIILANIEDEQQQRLFNNIQQACHASVFFMQWPLAIEAWEMNDYVLQGYLQGVLAIHQGKVIFSLGDQDFDLPEPFNTSVKKFASLQQLLESAEQKRALWQALYPYIYDAETNNA